MAGKRKGPAGLTVGMVVFDNYQGLTGVVADFEGTVVHLSRPTGMTWHTRAGSVRPATEPERRQLKAICAHVARQQRDTARP